MVVYMNIHSVHSTLNDAMVIWAILHIGIFYRATQNCPEESEHNADTQRELHGDCIQEDCLCSAKISSAIYSLQVAL